MTDQQKKDAAMMFRGLGNMLLSGVPLFLAMDAAKADTADKKLADELQRIKDAISKREIPEAAWAFLPQSVQLIWRAGQVKDLDQCCLRIAEILGA